MHLKLKRNRWLAIIGGMVLVIAAGWFVSRDAKPDPYQVRFSRVLTRPPYRIYYRGHYVPVAGGPFLWWLQGRLGYCGLKVDLVNLQSFNVGTAGCVLFGITGRPSQLGGRFVARVRTANTFADYPTLGAWSTANGNEHLVFWGLSPAQAGKDSTVIEIVDTNRNVILARHKL